LADVIVPIGGDGILLKTLHDFNKLDKPFFGINYGSVGFLMNSKSNKNLDELINNSKSTNLNPLKMIAIDVSNNEYESIAYNEVSLMRQSHQASKFQIKINNVTRMNELICDGVLVSTSAGSTAYNLSAHGSILPLDSKLLALTPISAFRPRRWRGALLSEKSIIKINVLNSKDRQASVTADNIEFRNIKEVTIQSSNDKSCKILFDNNHSIEDKILNEQFEY
jgi:NAD+ kinase